MIDEEDTENHLQLCKLLRGHVSLDEWKVPEGNFDTVAYLKENNYIFSLQVWYNDFFGWALSYCLSIPSDAKTIEEAESEFVKFFEREDVQDILKRYDEVPYPARKQGISYEKQTDGEDSVEYYFRMNREIYNCFLDKLKEFNGFCEKFMEDEKFP